MPDPTPQVKTAFPKVLVVDDQLINVRLLERKLGQHEFSVLSASNGRDALQIADRDQPDVILLDVMMPEMDGIETCQFLKKNPRTKDIPVIFITARTSKQGKLEGLDAGAADYLVKPIDLDETLARVRTQIRIIDSHRENLSLTRALEESRRRTAMMHLTEGIAHNLNNLLGVVVGYLSLLRRNRQDPNKIERHCDHLDSAVQRMTRIVQQLTIIGQFDSIFTDAFPLRTILSRSVSRFQTSISSEFPVKVHTPLEKDYKIITNCELLEACLERLLINAYESYLIENPDAEIPPGGVELSVSLSDDRKDLLFDVMDRGPGVPEWIKDNIFDPFVSSFSSVGKGMGLTIVQHSMQSLGGSIQLTPRDGGGTRARLVHPLDLTAKAG